METLLSVVGAILLSFGLFGVFAGASKLIYGMHLALGALLLIYAGVRSARRVVEVMGTSTARGGANVLVQTVLILGIGALLAWLSMRPSMQKHWDWTEGQMHSLSQGTLDM